MKVLEAGGEVPKWVGRIIKCRQCGARLQLEVGDKVKEVADQRDGNYYVVRCPSCHYECTLN